eukprot:PhM_4_TR2230/c0_g1_i1/m.40262/K00166/BCKDHA, bkdA1; 2-oxoisovalerate dehydrogenase E1 component alpha subunit
MLRFSRRFLCHDAKTVCSRSAVWNIKYSDEEHVFTNVPEFTKVTTQPMYRILNADGVPTHDARPNGLSKESARHMMTTMLRQATADNILHEAQRQGRLSFYMTSICEEAIAVGSAAGLKSQDLVYGQYREPAVLLYRGFTLKEMIAQCMGTVDDTGRGRQMPMHFGSPELNFETISSPLGTQIPQASGAGYAFRIEGADRVCACYFGEGAASEGDFHAALNMAATLKSQTLFLCRNNGYAISTPANQQYAGDGIVGRGAGYGIPSIRVDGNDLLAVMDATQKARARSIAEHTPILIEFMSYRGGHHSTSDDSTRYRSKEELDANTSWGNAIKRFEAYATAEGWWNEADTKEIRESTRAEVLQLLSEQEKRPLHPVNIMLEDVYDEMTPTLKRQTAELEDHVKRHPHLLHQGHH